MKIQNGFQFSNLLVPNKDETIIKFLDYVKPLILDEEYRLNQLKVNQYFNDYISNVLHNTPLDKAQDENIRWLVDWWIKYVYLSSWWPVTHECNTPMIFSHKNMHEYDVAGVVVVMVFKIAKVYLELKKHNNFINDQSFNLKKAFFLNRLIYLFFLIYEPNQYFDSYYIKDGMSDFVIIYQHIAYKVKVIKDGLPISINDIYMNLKQIFNQKSQQNIDLNFISVGVNWSEAKIILDKLLINFHSQKLYQFLKDAIVAICHNAIKDEVFLGIFKFFMFVSDYNSLHGKGFLISIADNKNVIMSANHTKVDGSAKIDLMSLITQLSNKKLLLLEMKKIPSYEIIDFKLERNIQDLLKLKFEQYINYINRTDAIYIESTKLNKQLCKQLKIVSTDRLIQLLYQIAQYKTNQQFYNSYAAVDTRNFFKVLTECIRYISNESKQFAIDFINHKLKDKEIIFEKLQEIFNIHYQRSKDCHNAHRINRYMLGLELTYNENYQSSNITRPTFFISSEWKTIIKNILSTSSIILNNIEWVYFDLVHENGLGIFYTIKKYYTRFSISYWKEDFEYTNFFSSNLEWAIELSQVARRIEV